MYLSTFLLVLATEKKKNFVQKSVMVSDFLLQFEDFFLILRILKTVTT